MECKTYNQEMIQNSLKKNCDFKKNGKGKELL